MIKLRGQVSCLLFSIEEYYVLFLYSNNSCGIRQEKIVWLLSENTVSLYKVLTQIFYISVRNFGCRLLLTSTTDQQVT